MKYLYHRRVPSFHEEATLLSSPSSDRSEGTGDEGSRGNRPSRAGGSHRSGRAGAEAGRGDRRGRRVLTEPRRDASARSAATRLAPGEGHRRDGHARGGGRQRPPAGTTRGRTSRWRRLGGAGGSPNR